MDYIRVAPRLGICAQINL